MRDPSSLSFPRQTSHHPPNKIIFYDSPAFHLPSPSTRFSSIFSMCANIATHSDSPTHFATRLSSSTHLFIPNSLYSRHSYQTSQTLHLHSLNNFAFKLTHQLSSYFSREIECYTLRTLAIVITLWHLCPVPSIATPVLSREA